MAEAVCANGHRSTQIEAGWQFCEHCGAPLQAVCPRGHPVAVGSQFCTECGVPIGGGASAAPATPSSPVPGTSSPFPPPPAAPAPTPAPTPAPAPARASAPSRPLETAPSTIDRFASTQTVPMTPRPPDGVVPYGAPPQIARRRSNRGWVVVLICLMVIVVGLGAVLAYTQFHGKSAAGQRPRVGFGQGSGTSPSPPPSGGDSTPPQASTPGAAPATAAAAAQQLSTLLVANGQNRSAVLDATRQIAQCGDVQGAVSTLQSGATSRQNLLNQLGQMDLSALPNGAALDQDLTSAWQASIDSDTSYAKLGSRRREQRVHAGRYI